MGNIYYKKDDPEKALDEYLKGLALKPGHAEAQLNAVLILQKKAEHDKAAQYFYKAGLFFLRSGDRANALKAYEYLKQTKEERLIQLLHDAMQTSIH